MYVYMYVCMYVCMYVHMYVRKYVRTFVRMYVRTYVCMYVPMNVSMYVHMYVCMYVPINVCIYVFMYLCTVCMSIFMYVFNVLGKIYKDLLQKPPEPTDAFDLVRNISPSWYDIGSELLVPPDVCESLKRDMSLSDEAKLRQILNDWIKFETADVTWKTILKALQALRRKDIIREILKYLEKPAIYSKYIKKDDFIPCPDFL